MSDERKDATDEPEAAGTTSGDADDARTRAYQKVAPEPVDDDTTREYARPPTEERPTEEYDKPVEAAEPEAEAEKVPLHESLLHGEEVATQRRPKSRWAYPLWGILILSLFVGYQVAILLVFNTPGKGLAKDFHKTFLTETKGYDYFRATRQNQSWAMFAPNPNRTNSFVRVFVEDQDGQLWDFEQDIWGIDRYPYLWYDRRGKINRRIDNKKHYQRIYGAWVCREWERQHGGEPAKSVTFVKRYTRVPHPKQVIKNRGWNQWEAPYKQKEQETITCKVTINAQLPNYLRERYGLPLVDEEEVFRPVRDRTWWDIAEAEKRKAERQAEIEARRAEWAAKREQRGERVRKRRREPVEIDPRGPIRRDDDDSNPPPRSEDEVDY